MVASRMNLDEDALVAAAELVGKTGAKGFEIGLDAVTATVQCADLLVQLSQTVKVWLLVVAAPAQHLRLLNDVEFDLFSVGAKVWPHIPEKADDAVTVKRPGPCSTGVAVWLAYDDLLCWPVLVEDIDDLPVGIAQCDDADRVPRSGRTRSIWFPRAGIDNADGPFALEASRRPGQ